MCEDVEQAADLLTNKLTYNLEKLAPVKTFQVRKKYAPWLSDSTKLIIKEKNQAQKLAAETRNLEDWHQYKNLRNTARNKMKQEKKLWEEAKLNKHSLAKCQGLVELDQLGSSMASLPPWRDDKLTCPASPDHEHILYQ